MQGFKGKSLGKKLQAKSQVEMNEGKVCSQKMEKSTGELQVRKGGCGATRGKKKRETMEALPNLVAGEDQRTIEGDKNNTFKRTGEEKNCVKENKHALLW